MKIPHMEVGYQNWVKGVKRVHFGRNFWETLKNKDFGLTF